MAMRTSEATDIETVVVGGLAGVEEDPEEIEEDDKVAEDEDLNSAAASVERVVLSLEPARLPRLEITDEHDVTRYRTVGLADLLSVLDRSAVLESLKQEAIRTTRLPELPERTLLAGVVETPHSRHVHLCGWLPPREQAFVWQGDSYVVAIPALVWRAKYSEEERRLDGLGLALTLPGEAVGVVGAETPVYRWPFANVYAYGSFAKVCWYTMRRIQMDAKDVVRLGVEGFLSVRDNGDLFGRGMSQNSPHQDYAEFLAAAESEGLKDEWLIPHQMTVEQFYEGGYTS